MTSSTAGCGVFAALYAAAANAIKASGAIVQVEPNVFEQLLRQQGADARLVVFSPSGFFRKNQYLTAYKGLIFYTKSTAVLSMPADTELIQAEKIWIPQM